MPNRSKVEDRGWTPKPADVGKAWIESQFAVAHQSDTVGDASVFRAEFERFLEAQEARWKSEVLKELSGTFRYVNPLNLPKNIRISVSDYLQVLGKQVMRGKRWISS